MVAWAQLLLGSRWSSWQPERLSECRFPAPPRHRLETQLKMLGAVLSDSPGNTVQDIAAKMSKQRFFSKKLKTSSNNHMSIHHSCIMGENTVNSSPAEDIVTHNCYKIKSDSPQACSKRCFRQSGHWQTNEELHHHQPRQEGLFFFSFFFCNMGHDDAATWGDGRGWMAQQWATGSCHGIAVHSIWHQ